jgi:hypothetical protein
MKHSFRVLWPLALLGTSGCVGAVVGFMRELNESAKGIGTRFKLSKADAETIEAQARAVVPAVLGPGFPAEPPLHRR